MFGEFEPVDVWPVFGRGPDGRFSAPTNKLTDLTQYPFASEQHWGKAFAANRPLPNIGHNAGAVFPLIRIVTLTNERTLRAYADKAFDHLVAHCGVVDVDVVKL